VKIEDQETTSTGGVASQQASRECSRFGPDTLIAGPTFYTVVQKPDPCNIFKLEGAQTVHISQVNF